MKYVDVFSPVWADPEHAAIRCDVQFEGEPRPLAFNAMASDPEPHGRDIFQRCLAGEFGAIAPCPPPSDEVLRRRAFHIRDYLLAEAAIRISPLQDASDVNEATPAELAALTAWKRYRLALNRIDTQPAFPREITWPLMPAFPATNPDAGTAPVPT